MSDGVVAHLVHSLNLRAIADVVRTVADEMVLADRRVVVLARNVPPDGLRPALAPVIDLGRAGSRTVRTLPRLVAALDGLRVHAIFAHAESATRVAVAASRLVRPRPAVVTVTHNHYSTYARNHPRFRHVVDGLALRAADVVAGVSPGVTDDLRSSFPAVAARATTLPAPLTRAAQLHQLAAVPVCHEWFDGRPVIVSIAHLHPRKDQVTLLHALAQIGLDQSDAAPHLLLIGALDGAYADEVKDLIIRLGLSDRVQLLGAVANPFPYLSRATAFVLTSRNEGMSIAVLEALALGIPVVTTDAPSGPRWLVEGGRCGLVVPVGDATAVAGAIQQLLGDAALRARLAARGRQRVGDFMPAIIAQRYLQVLDTLS